MQIAMDPHYDPSHKASSITSTTSTNSWDTVPSLATSSVCDIDSPLIKDQPTFEDSLQTSNDREYLTMYFNEVNNDQSIFNNNECNNNPSNLLRNTENTPIYLHQSHEITVPHSTKLSNETNKLIKPEPINTINNNEQVEEEDDTSSVLSKRSRQARELLTEDEKRANHIASEQKRRNTIRSGFKEMTEIIPTLKNINNSKSTILFKAVEYIRHLDKRNRGLREKLNTLQLRLEVEGRMNGLIRTPYHLLHRRHQQQSSPHHHYLNDHQNKKSRSNHHHSHSHLPPETMAALIAHKNQQKQLELLQEQLRYQQQLLAKHNIPTNGLNSSSSLYNSISIPTDHTSSFHHHHHHRASVNSPSSSSTTITSYPSSSQHRLSAPALVMPNMVEDGWNPTSTLNTPSFNIPADE
ncbi:hypothetical protein BJ944DRAFT_247543 [Cunninghamella echinulata]|nr:hypothetical protein BJ944DRAFT_247543 [Cunninghamella echinulata]